MEDDKRKVVCLSSFVSLEAASSQPAVSFCPRTRTAFLVTIFSVLEDFGCRSRHLGVFVCRVLSAKLVITFQLARGVLQREAWSFLQREQEYSEVPNDFSMCALSIEVPSYPLLPAEKLFAEATGDPHGLFDVSKVRNQEVQAT